MPKKQSKTITSNPDVSETKSKVEVVALRNTFLPDGTFVAENSRILVDADYAKRLFEAKDSSFEIIN
jgi:hypothetical protein